MSDFLCPFPWISPCVTTSGTFRVCPVAQSSQSKGLVLNETGKPPHLQNGSTTHEVLNSDSLIDLRKRMMNGEDVSETCRRCQFEEEHNLPSRRRLELSKFHHFDKEFVKRWTTEDGRLKNGSPISMIILRMGNKCNLACRMCGPSSSSAWYKEWHETRHKGFKEDGQRVALEMNENGVVRAQPNLYEWTEDHSAQKFIASSGAHLQRLHFSGGEPLLSRGHLHILKNLVEEGRASQISLEYNTNLTVLPQEILDLWSQFNFVELGISIDGPPEVNEYIRYPIRTEALLANLHKLDHSSVPGRFWISTTVQIYNLFYLQELQEWLRQQDFIRILPEISWHILRSPKELSIFALPENLKRMAVEDLQHSAFKNLAETIYSEDQSESFSDFFAVTKKMDSYRGQSIENLSKLRRILSAHLPK